MGISIYSWNVNGLRAVERKGDLQQFLKKHSPDILLLQEIKGNASQFSPFLTEHEEYEQHYHSAEKAGYSGVSLWVKKSIVQQYGPATIVRGMRGWDDTEGRIIRADFGDSLSVLSVYVPNGGKSKEAFEGKLLFFELFSSYLRDIKESGRNVVVGGDFNCARTEIDLAEPKRHQTTIGFLPEERERLELFFTYGFIDTFRNLHGDKEGVYTYWANLDFKHRPNKPRDLNIGWRIDYIFTHPTDTLTLERAEVFNDVMGSDHCPLFVHITT